MDEPSGPVEPTHRRAFDSTAPLFLDPFPECNGSLTWLGGDEVAIAADGGCRRVRQEIYQCTGCGSRIGTLDGVVRWAERPVAIRAMGGGSVDPRFLADPELSKTERLVGTALLTLAGEAKRCRPTNGQLAEMTKLSPRGVQIAIGHLNTRGYIQINRDYGLEGRREIVIP
jgi:hypothetical protein